MATVLFLDHFWIENLGIMQLSAVLKRAGHASHVTTGGIGAIARAVERYKPDLLAFSCFMTDYQWHLERAAECKQRFPELPIIFGGYAPTFLTSSFCVDQVDYLCRGEGEEPLLHLVEYLETGRPAMEDLNLLCREDGFRAKPFNIVRDLDRLPWVDRDLFDFGRDNPHPFMILTSRGCVHSCSFCTNTLMREEAGPGTPTVRFRALEDVLAELRELKKTRKVSEIKFVDYTFNQDQARMLELLERYNCEIDLPFKFDIRGNFFTEDQARLLARSKCLLVHFGIESGSERLRNQVLNKNLSDAQILAAAELLHRYKLRFVTFNMWGLPHETLADAERTIELNHRVRPLSPVSTLYLPFAGHPLTRQSIEEGLVDPAELPLVQFEPWRSCTSIVKNPDARRIEMVMYFSHLSVVFPATWPFFRWLARTVRPNWFFRFLYAAITLGFIVRWGPHFAWIVAKYSFLRLLRR